MENIDLKQLIASDFLDIFENKEEFALMVPQKNHHYSVIQDYLLFAGK